MIDEFTDVNQGEKDLMKLWNLFSLEKRLEVAINNLEVSSDNYCDARKIYFQTAGLLQRSKCPRLVLNSSLKMGKRS